MLRFENVNLCQLVYEEMSILADIYIWMHHALSILAFPPLPQHFHLLYMLNDFISLISNNQILIECMMDVFLRNNVIPVIYSEQYNNDPTFIKLSNWATTKSTFTFKNHIKKVPKILKETLKYKVLVQLCDIFLMWKRS